MSRVHIATALLRRGPNVLLVASRYPNHQAPLWTLPGGRQEPRELLGDCALRELREETGLQGTVRELCYVSESYDGTMHYTNFTFAVHAAGEPRVMHAPGDHVTDVRWVPIEQIAQRISVAVVREPLLAFLNGTLPRYAGYAEADVAIEFPD